MDVKEFKVQDVPIDRIVVDSENPNRMSEEQFKALKHAIEKFGYLTPVVLDQDYKIADGEHRYLVYKELGRTTIPAYVLDLKDTDRRLLRQIMNKIKGEHNQELDKLEFEKLLKEMTEQEIKLFLPEENFSFLKEKEAKEEEFDEELALKKEPKYKIEQGDLFKLGEHLLLCGDSTNQEDVTRIMGTEKADVLFTDPPYNLAFSGTIPGQFEEVRNDNLNVSRYEEFIEKLGTSMLNNIKPGASLYVCIDFRNYHRWVNFLEKNGIEILNCIVWDKVFAGIGYKYRFRHEFIIFAGHRNKITWLGDTVEEDFIKLEAVNDPEIYNVLDLKGYSIPLSNDNFLRIKIEQSAPQRVQQLEGKSFKFRTNAQTNTDVLEGFSMNYFSQRELEWAEGIVHPTMKPVRLISKLLKNSSWQNEIVLDLCGGSGSTIIASEQTGRKCRMIELDPRYCSVIIERYEAYTGQKGVKINSA